MARFLRQLADPEGQRQSISEANAARQQLMQAGLHECPAWIDIYDGARPGPAKNTEPGEWPHGWQYLDSSRIESFHRDNEIMPHMQPASQALFRSQSGPAAASHLHAVPTSPELTIAPECMRTLLLRRLRLPLPLAARTCTWNA